jgi:DNA-nicking Smr family endonuclease
MDQSLPRPQADLSGFRIGGRRPDTALPDRIRQSPPGRSEQPLLRMDAKAHARMKRGKLPVEGRIDLHGLTLADARPRLVSFILSSHARGKRLVLIITGKGRDRDDGDPVPMRKGQLKHLVPQWLSADPLRGVMLQVTEAHRRHGGSGAFYAYLRRK